ncbi:MAG: T9SS type A sorting domain-containing protein [Bacteroidetes bacterium]|nr:T9SS type A sorting domain-containing protein [Bacteroidota bacterium]
MGQYANKFSIVNNTDGSSTVYAIGLRLFKMTTGIASGLNEEKNEIKGVLAYPNPATSGGFISISLESIKTRIIKAELISVDGKSTFPLFKGYYSGTHESPFMLQLPNINPGNYIIQFTDDGGALFKQKLFIIN